MLMKTHRTMLDLPLAFHGCFPILDTDVCLSCDVITYLPHMQRPMGKLAKFNTLTKPWKNIDIGYGFCQHGNLGE